MEKSEKLRYNSRQLRKNMTRQESHLWYDFLKNLNITVHRQKVIGNYIADFYIAEYKLVIELDGSQHYTESGKCYDEKRDAFMRENGIEVFRIDNHSFNTNFEGVCDKIRAKLNMR